MYSIMLVGNIIFCSQFKSTHALDPYSSSVSVDEITSWKNAVEMMRISRFDIAVCDINSAKDDGMEFLRICSNEKLCQCVIIADSDLNLKKARLAIQLKAFDYLLKPFDREIAADSISRAFHYVEEQNSNDGTFFIRKSISTSVMQGNCEALENEIVTVSKLISEKQEQNECGAFSLEIASYVYETVSKQHQWIVNFITDYRLFRERLIKSSSVKSMMYQFEHFIREIMASLKMLYNFSEDKPIIKNACMYVLNHSDEKITQQDVAAICFVNKSYFSHVFKAETNISFVDYLSLVKITRAKKIIKENDDMVFEIALKLGYDDANYFCRKFKSITGITSKAYRERSKSLNEIYN